jgi:hypothetical protein
MVLTDKQIDEILSRIETPKLVRRTKAPVPFELTSDRKLSVEGQRRRVVKEVKELATAERNAPQPDDRSQREAAFYYRQLHDAVAYAEHWARGQYDLFEKDCV